jgi:hypothetical protein
MHQGMKIDNLAQELRRQMTSKKDLKAPTSCLRVAVERSDDQDLVDNRKGNLILNVQDHGKFHMTSHFHDQLGQWAGMPAKYYDRLRTAAPDLLADNVNHWLDHQVDEKTGQLPTRLIRLLDDQARAFLSNRYRCIDNFDLAEVALPVMTKAGCEVLSSNVDYNRLYLKVATPKLTKEVKKGDVVQLGVVLSNSEVGQGAVKIEPFIYRLACLNGMIIPDAGLRRFHVGRMSEELEAAQEIYKDETRAADDRAFMLKVRDVLDASFIETRFEMVMAQLGESTKIGIVKPLHQVVETVTKTYRLTEGQGDGILRHLAEGGDLTQWGLANAVTRTAEDQATYDDATLLERLGGELAMQAPPEFAKLTA